MISDTDIKYPLVTIITATYNLIKGGRVQTIIEALDSVQKQTYPNIEHLIIDGASTDGTIDLIQNYAQDKKNIVFSSEPDKGIYNAMNKGIRKARGKYIMILNSDDFYHHPKAIELLVNAVQENKARFAYANADILNPRETKTHTTFKANFNNVFMRMPFCHQTMLVEKKCFEEFGFFDEQFKIAADYHFILKLAYHNVPHTYVNETICTFRNGGFSQDFKLAYADVARVLKNVFPEISSKTANKIVKYRYVPNKILRDWLCHYTPQEQAAVLKRNKRAFLRFIRRRIIQLHLGKGRRKFTFLGITIGKDIY